jgi:hypothetical protein
MGMMTLLLHCSISDAAMLANPDITGMGGVVVRRCAAGQKRACQERSGAPAIV